jgi:predicted protein tyrosine phosphatase
MKIYVSSLEAAHHSVVAYQPHSIISFVDSDTQRPYFLNYDTDRHLVLNFNDINVSSYDVTHEQRLNLARFINFLTQHDMRYPLLIHCTLGISRSTAAAYIALNLHKKNLELEIAQYLRSKIPYALPNMTMISIADIILGREGRMIAAIEFLSTPNMKEAGGCKMVSTDFV